MGNPLAHGRFSRALIPLQSTPPAPHAALLELLLELGVDDDIINTLGESKRIPDLLSEEIVHEAGRVAAIVWMTELSWRSRFDINFFVTTFLDSVQPLTWS